MTEVAFLLNGTPVRVAGESPTRTLLDWLREVRGLSGTKEGCNEGDCGACTVMVTDAGGSKALNACILFLPQLDGKAVRTVEGIAGPTARCIRCKRRWSPTTAASAASARPASSSAWPSHT